MGRPREREAMTWELALAIRFGRPIPTALAVAAVALCNFVAVRWLSDAPILSHSAEAPTPLEPFAIGGIAMSLLIGYMIFGNGYF